MRRAAACRRRAFPARCRGRARLGEHEGVVVLRDLPALQRREHVRVVGGGRSGDVLLERRALEPRLPLALLVRAQREVKDLDRVPAAKRRERAVDERVVPTRDLDLGVSAVHDLADRLEERRRIVDRRERGEANGHPLGEAPVAAVRGWTERPQEAPDGPVARGNRGEHLARATRPSATRTRPRRS